MMERSLEVKNSLDKTGKRITILYLLGLLGVFLILLFIGITKEKPAENEKQDTYRDISTLWTLDYIVDLG